MRCRRLTACTNAHIRSLPSYPSTQFIGATNIPQQIDEAARRRFQRRIYVPLPNSAARRGLLLHQLSKDRHVLTDAEIEQVVTESKGYSGSDMAQLCSTAAASRDSAFALDLMRRVALKLGPPGQKAPVTVDHFTAALKTVKATVSEDKLLEHEAWDAEFGTHPDDVALQQFAMGMEMRRNWRSERQSASAGAGGGR